MATLDLNKIQTTVENLASELGINLEQYGNASPIKFMTKALIEASKVLQESAIIINNERNPLTATELRSKLGQAVISGLNPAFELTNSSGKITVDPKGQTVTIANHAVIKSASSIQYYVNLASEAIMINSATELAIMQGEFKSASFTITGERWQTCTLTAVNFVPASEISVYIGGNRITVGKSIDQGTDCFVTMNADGQTEIVVHNDSKYESGQSISIDYVDSIGIEGDNVNVGETMTATSFAYAGDKDITSSVSIVISEPIIGGTDFEHFADDIVHATLLCGHNNLIGTNDQLLAYAKRFKQYVVQTSYISSGVLNILCIRNPNYFMQTQDYWTLASNLALTDSDVNALANHINSLSDKALDKLVNVLPANIETFKVQISVKMTEESPASIANALVDYLLANIYDRTYELSNLYNAISAIDGITQVYCQFIGNTNEYGSAEPADTNSILICNSATITVNGVRHNYGS